MASKADVPLETDDGDGGYSDGPSSPQQAETEQKEKESGKFLGRPDNETEVVKEIPTRNYALYLVGLSLGFGVGFIFWMFFRKDLCLWGGAGLGLFIARILELRVWPQKTVRIWADIVDEEMLKPPKWKKTCARGADFYIQSDFVALDNEDDYIRSTAVYHLKGTNALSIHERYVWKVQGFEKLTWSGPVGTTASILGSLAFNFWKYCLDSENWKRTTATFIVGAVVGAGVLIILGCMAELEFRKRRFFQYNYGYDRVTNVALHGIGKVRRQTFGCNRFTWEVTQEQSNGFRLFVMWVKILMYPIIIVFKLCMFIVHLSIINGAFCLWIFLTIGLGFLYRCHLDKTTQGMEVATTFLWLAFIVNLFEVWYTSAGTCAPQTLSSGDDTELKKLALCTEERIPQKKLTPLFICFLISLLMIFLSAVLMSALLDRITEDPGVLDFDKSWRLNAKDTSKWITCDAKDSLVENFSYDNYKSFGTARELLQSDGGSGMSHQYDLLCKDKNYYSMAFSVTFCSLDWFMLLFMMFFWHLNDLYQWDSLYRDSQARVWHQLTSVKLDALPSKITWIGRIMGSFYDHSPSFFMHEKQAAILHDYLSHVVPWYKLHEGEPQVKNLIPVQYQID